MMAEDNVQDHMERAPIFPGNSCYPLSPDANQQYIDEDSPCNPSDQLNLILEMLGTPSSEDKQFISDENARIYLDSFPIKEKQDLSNIFPGSSPNELDVLEGLLQFNPSKRMTLD
mmetsp:Transcript_34507/g.6217  ORF Transcript_34507/g.6217 Transcript_34507/m.6217 type:complete len:115 (+) Transcript_34507:698-1042(+)